MTDARAALTALTITEHSGLTGARAGRLADKIAAEWLPEQGVVGRNSLADALMTDDMREHGWGHEREITLGWADAILASGVVADAADVRRQTAEDIAAAIEADAEKRRPQTFWRKVRAGAAGPSDPNRWFWEGHMHAARLAREVGGDRG